MNHDGYDMKTATRAILLLAAIALLVGGTSCTFDSSLRDVTCDQEGAREDGRTCRDGYWVAGDDVTQDATDSEDDAQDVVEDVELDLVTDVEPDTDPDGGCEEQTWYRDSDGDGYGAEESSVESCDRPSNIYVQQSGDCDENASDINPGASEACDTVDNNCDGTIDEGCPCSDGDTRPCGQQEGQCERGEQACDVSGTWGTCDGAVGPEMEVCDTLDNDCDGNVDEDLVRNCGIDVGQCEFGTETCNNGSWGTCMDQVGPQEETCNGFDDDCDREVDEDAKDAGTWYADSDGDGSGDPSNTVEACDQPTDYVSNADDCDDSDANAFTEVTGYADSDGDGYTTGGAQTLCTDGTVPSGFIDTQNGDDCDDSDSNVYTELTVYEDSDGDGYTTGGAQTVCTDGTVPSGFSDTQNGDDCDDSDSNVYTEVTVYEDSDGDGYTTGGAQTVCTDGSVPSGFSDTQNGDDCDDNNDSVYQEYDVFLDNDEDGFGTGTRMKVCGGGSTPVGYTDQDGDCNDSDEDINPNATEECGDNIDSDCDGQDDPNDPDADDYCSTQHSAASSCETIDSQVCCTAGASNSCQ